MSSDKYPYLNRNDECNYNSNDVVFKIDHYKVYNYMNNRDLERLVCQGAVSAAIRINNCIKSYQSGIIDDRDGKCGCSHPESTNHAVTLVGYGEDVQNRGCEKYWLIKNSWG